jgi:hypothetical protein
LRHGNHFLRPIIHSEIAGVHANFCPTQDEPGRETEGWDELNLWLSKKEQRSLHHRTTKTWGFIPFSDLKPIRGFPLVGIQYTEAQPMNVDLAQELLSVLGSSLENLETQQAALLQFLKDKGTVTDDQLAPYLAQAGKASNVRWRAAHIRLEHLFAGEKQREGKLAEEKQHQAGAAPSPSHDQEKEAQDKVDESGEPAPQREEAVGNAANESGGAQSVSAKNGEQNKPATSEDKKAST